ncbi:MAG: hypothetical protein HC911_06950 [Chloroflexaceae bacterium]|nr:hypothetical protein [Chloroflexaceae bacterium]
MNPITQETTPLLLDGEHVAQILGILMKAIKRLSADDLALIANGQAKLKVVVEGTSTKVVRPQPADSTNPALQALAVQLEQIVDREAALLLLNQDPRVKLKANLVSLARIFAINVSARDRRDVIEEKIVRSVVDSRVRSEIIRGMAGAPTVPN